MIGHYKATARAIAGDVASVDCSTFDNAADSDDVMRKTAGF